MEREGEMDTDFQWKLRLQKATARPGLKIPTSLYVSHDDCCNFSTEGILQRRAEAEPKAEPRVVFWQLGRRGPADRDQGPGQKTEPKFESFVDVLRYVALSNKGRGRVVGVNPSDGKAPAGYYGELNKGDYVGGGQGLEADVCRQIPALWPSLLRGVIGFADIAEGMRSSRNFGEVPYDKDDPGYPFFPYGPSSCEGARAPARYSDGIYTPGVEIARGAESSGYALLSQSQRAAVDILSVAPPVGDKDICTEDLIQGSIFTMFAAPLMQDPENDILVLPAWGCGPRWKNKAKKIAYAFARAVQQWASAPSGTGDAGGVKRGGLYREVHFVFEPPPPPPTHYSGLRTHPLGANDHAPAARQRAEAQASVSQQGPPEINAFKTVFRSEAILYSMGEAPDDLEPSLCGDFQFPRGWS